MIIESLLGANFILQFKNANKYNIFYQIATSMLNPCQTQIQKLNYKDLFIVPTINTYTKIKHYVGKLLDWIGRFIPF